jgi:hypothetical protein
MLSFSVRVAVSDGLVIKGSIGHGPRINGEGARKSRDYTPKARLQARPGMGCGAAGVYHWPRCAAGL